MSIKPTSLPRALAVGPVATLLFLAACTRPTPPAPLAAGPQPPVQIAQPEEAQAPPPIELGEAPRLPDAGQ
jgi:hypothetical protein